MTTSEFRKSLAAARRVGTPLIAIRTADPESAMNHFRASMNGKANEYPILRYDFIGGLVGCNDVGSGVAPVGEDRRMSPPDALLRAVDLPIRSVLFFLNPHKLWEQPDVIQGIWNLRDDFKTSGRMLVLITTIGAMLPSELANDVMVFDEPLPSVDDIKAIVNTTYKAARDTTTGLPAMTPEVESKASDALIGLGAFAAETAFSMSISKSGVSLATCWQRKCQTIEQTRGLSVHRGPERFEDVHGCDALVEYLRAVMHGVDQPRGVVFVDEINDAMAGSGTDSSGVKGDFQGTLLQHLQNRDSDAILLIGPPGTGKTLIGKAAASCADRIMINFDIASMQQGIVGSSGENLRSALSVVDATTQGRALWIGTCNALTNLSPQLRRRFRDGTFYVDIPNEAGRGKLWDLFEGRYGIRGNAGPRPKDDGWTGAEIENCCKKAYRLKTTLKEAARYIIPISVSGADQILSLRQQASGKFLSASIPGVFEYKESKPSIGKTRTFTMEGQ